MSPIDKINMVTDIHTAAIDFVCEAYDSSPSPEGTMGPQCFDTWPEAIDAISEYCKVPGEPPSPEDLPLDLRGDLERIRSGSPIFPFADGTMKGGKWFPLPMKGLGIRRIFGVTIGEYILKIAHTIANQMISEIAEKGVDAFMAKNMGWQEGFADFDCSRN